MILPLIQTFINSPLIWGIIGGVGQAEKNNGLVLLVCKPCQQVTIATGNGTKKVLTDDICQNVINEKIIPEFKKGDFYNGIKKGVEELIEKWH